MTAAAERDDDAGSRSSLCLATRNTEHGARITDHGCFVCVLCHERPRRRRRSVLIITNAKRARPTNAVPLIDSASFDLFRFVRRRNRAYDDPRARARRRLPIADITGRARASSLSPTVANPACVRYLPTLSPLPPYLIIINNCDQLFFFLGLVDIFRFIHIRVLCVRTYLCARRIFI